MTTIQRAVDLGLRVRAAALQLAAEGYKIFPLHGLREVVVPVPDRDGEVRAEWRCTCRRPACPNPGKHPVGALTPNGHKNALADVAAASNWFRVPDAEGLPGEWAPWNLGVATGSGLLVVDAEAKKSRPDLPSGLEVLDDWETWTGGTTLPFQTRRVRSGGGGLHLWYAYDARLRVPPRNRVLPAVDLKADGGYVLAWPSRHVSGHEYVLEEDAEVAQLPAATLGWALTVRGGRYVARRAAEGAGVAQPDDYDFRAIVAGRGCPPGHRDYFVNDLCFRLRRSGASLDDAAQALRREWLKMAQPIGDEFPWDMCLYKLRRVWEEVQPEDVVDIPAWRPPASDAARVEITPAPDAPEAPGPETPLVAATELLNRPELTFHLTDAGNGIRFAQRMRDTLRFCAPEERWYLWDGSRWRPDQTRRALHLTEELARDLYVEASLLTDGDERRRVEAWAHQTESVARRQAALASAGAQPQLGVEPDALDTDPWLLVVRNGTVDLRTGMLRASAPSDLNTKICDVDYLPDASCPRWRDHVRLITGGDVVLESWLARAVGYTLTGLTGEHKVFFLWGAGNNGKSTFVDVISKILGTYAAKADESLLTGSGGHPTQLADLRGARLVVADETDRTKRLAEQRIKMMTGREIKARYMRRDFFTYVPRFKLWIAGNHKPEIQGADDGIWRRMQLVPFGQTLAPDVKILDYDEVLLGEAPGILNWALDGLRAWRELGGLGTPEVVARATREYRLEEDTIGAWLAETCDLGVVDAEVEAARLYESYRWWCHANGFTEIRSSVALGRELASRGFTRDVVRVGAKTTRVWRGVRVRAGV